MLVYLQNEDLQVQIYKTKSFTFLVVCGLRFFCFFVGFLVLN